ncbi:hypothetical protein MX989_10075 [Enterobacter sichuanensis]|uniref:Uncharacterized protein n=1 Tax=Enterobacter sichuanensis TaxID=2071710 RepID=A0AAE4DVN1_9ENTR|nr:hypothetical protein [Enterobacter sichuanensis]MDR9946425.1 hypothetical protein [Enterobacter sichuanensis]
MSMTLIPLPPGEDFFCYFVSWLFQPKSFSLGTRDAQIREDQAVHKKDNRSHLNIVYHSKDEMILIVLGNTYDKNKNKNITKQTILKKQIKAILNANIHTFTRPRKKSSC